jgi:hypothetical protein
MKHTACSKNKKKNKNLNTKIICSFTRKRKITHNSLSQQNCMTVYDIFDSLCSTVLVFGLLFHKKSPSDVTKTVVVLQKQAHRTCSESSSSRSMAVGNRDCWSFSTCDYGGLVGA